MSEPGSSFISESRPSKPTSKISLFSADHPQWPPWRPSSYQGKQSIKFFITETISSHQYDDEDCPNRLSVCGTIICKVFFIASIFTLVQANLEGLPEVTTQLTPKPLPNSTATISQLAFHPCVQNSDSASQTKKIAFIPPSDRFVLCRYILENVRRPPLRCFYQMKVS
jgi:hypothetical protein